MSDITEIDTTTGETPLIGEGIEVRCPRCGSNRVQVVVVWLQDGTNEQTCLGCHVVMMAQVASTIGAGQ